MYRKRPGGAPEHPGAPQSTPERPRSLKLPYFYLQKAFLSEKSIQLPLFLPKKTKKSIQIPRHTRAKRTSTLKLPYFYVQKLVEPLVLLEITLFLPTKSISYRRIYPSTLKLPHQTHLGA